MSNDALTTTMGESTLYPKNNDLMHIAVVDHVAYIASAISETHCTPIAEVVNVLTVS